MRPVLKLSLVLLVLIVCAFSYFGLKALNGIKAHTNDTFPATLQNACMSYFLEYNQYPPASDNKRLTAALLGDNSRHIMFLSLSKNRLNADGEIVDHWGTPYKFSLQNSGLQITSAGPDKTFGTADDIVTNPPEHQSLH